MKRETYYQGKLIFVTGGSEGIGKSIAVLLTQQGADVVIASRHFQKCEAALQEMERVRLFSRQRLAYRIFDVISYSETEGCLQEMVKSFGVPDFLIHCAGTSHPGYLEEVPMKEHEQMVDINLMGTIRVNKAMLPFFQQKRRGHIVNVSSIAGFIGLFGYTTYCAAKYGVMGFSEALRREVKPYGIKVSVLCPPNTRTPGLESENRYKPAEVLATEEKIKVLEPEEVAQALIKALPQGKKVIIPTRDGILSYYLSRYAPWLLDFFVKRPKATTKE